jgi:hypothetical protein
MFNITTVVFDGPSQLSFHRHLGMEQLMFRLIYFLLTGKYCDNNRREMKNQMRHRAAEKKNSY